MRFAHRTDWELRPNRFSRALDQHRASGKPIFDLTTSNPPAAELNYQTENLLSAFHDSRVFEYNPDPKGLLAARCAVVEYYDEVARRTISEGHRQTEAHVSAEQLVLTTSTSEGYSFVFRLLCEPGTEVLIPTPSYPLFDYLAGLQDVRLSPYHLFYDHGWQIDFHSLQRAITPRTRAIILVNPNNPTGSYISAAEMAQLNVICRNRELAIIVDEVFLDYSLDVARPSFAFNTQALTFTLSGVSKISGLPQMKLAWVVVSGPGPLAAEALARMEVIADTYLSMNTPVQLAAAALLAERHNVQKQLSSRVRENLTELNRQLAGTMVSSLVVQGGWYAVLRVPRVRSDEDFAIALLEREQVLVQPGYFYDFPSDGYVVVSLITPQATFCEGMKRMMRFVAGA